MKLGFFGVTYPASGYGRATLEWATALQRNGADVYLGWERRTKKDPLWNEFSLDEKALFEKEYEKQRIGIINSPPFPEILRHNDAEFRIIYTMVEATLIRKDWVKNINGFNALFVPANFLVQAAKDSGVKIPVYVASQGVNISDYPFFRRPDHRKIFRFGTASYLDERKNASMMMQAFASAFPRGDEPVEFFMKNSNPKFDVRSLDKRIRVINDRLSIEEMRDFYNNLECFVFPSRAEGSGLPPREAMSTGCPAIVTNFSGLEEISRPEINYVLNDFTVDKEDERGAFDQQPGFQANVNIKELIYYMRYAFENWAETRERGKMASQFIQENYSWDICAQKMLNLVKEIDAKLPKSQVATAK